MSGARSWLAAAACSALLLLSMSPSRMTTTPAPPQAETLPVLGTQLGQFPPGAMKVVADRACVTCHSADIALQQRLNPKQWTAAVDKMVRWGAPVSDGEKEALVAYLVENFGPGNDRFEPVAALPVP